MLPFRTRASLGFALVLAFFLALAPGAVAATTTLRLEYSPMARHVDVEQLQAIASNEWLGPLYVAFPDDLKPRIHVISIENLEHGVAFRIEYEGTDAERGRVDAIARSRLEQLAQDSHLQPAYRLSAETPGWFNPFVSLPGATVAGMALAVLALLGLLAWALTRKRFLSLPMVGGMPILGILPAGIGMGGRFLELQGQPSQALGFFVRRFAQLARSPFRELAVMGLESLDASAAATACLSISLLREQGRVLVVDLAGDASNLPAILEETDDTGELPGKGTLRSTSVADLDLLTGLVPFEHRRPPLPTDMLSRYRWVVYHAPAGTPIEHLRHVLVLTGPLDLGAVRHGMRQCWWHRAKVLGLCLVGAETPQKLRDRYLARYYFERLRSQESPT